MNNIDFSKLSDFQYLISQDKSGSFIFEAEAYLFGIVIIIIASAIFYYTTNTKVMPRKRSLQNFAKWLLGSGFLLIVITFLRIQKLGFFTTRILLFIPFIIVGVYSLYFVFSWFVLLPKRVNKFQEAKLRSKYIPRKKKKGK